MARLPSGYQELKYIESTGTQWIDTGIPPFDGIIANFMAYISRSIASRTLFGTGGDNGWGAYMGGNALWDNYNDDSLISISSDYTGHITIVKNGRNSTFTTSRGTISYAHGNTYPQDSRTIFLFRKNGSSRSYGIFRLFLFSLSDQNGNFLWLGAPCRRLSDGAIGMYDLVSQSFFGNSGTGEFIAGIPVIEPTWGSGVSQVSRKLLMRRVLPTSKLPAEYQEVEWIGFTGSNTYIATGLYTNKSYEIQVVFKSSINSTRCLIGVSNDSPYTVYTYYVAIGSNRQFSFGTNAETIISNVFYDGQKSTLVYNGDGGKVFYNGEPLSGDAVVRSSAYTQIFIGHRTRNNQGYNGEIYYVKITDKDTGDVVREYIPCYHKSSGEIGMYDIAGEKFYNNSRAGAFTRGPNVGWYI